MELKLYSEMPPSVNHYLGYRAVMRGGRPISVSYCTKEAERYKKRFAEYVAAEAVGQGWEMPVKTRHVYVDAVFYFPATDMDSNNYWKCMLDAITDSGRVWADDNIVCERTMAIYYDAEHPHVELVIHPADYIGIFEDVSHLEWFESKCFGCTRYARNCSLLNKAKIGKIQPEIRNGECSKYHAKKAEGQKQKQTYQNKRR